MRSVWIAKWFPAIPLFLVIGLLAGIPLTASAQSSPCADNNPGLVADCDVLLEARDTLAGSATLNWSANTPIADWDGVRLDGTPLRVVRLDLREMGLTGSIPDTLGSLSSLAYLNLRSNQLSGSVTVQT